MIVQQMQEKNSLSNERVPQVCSQFEVAHKCKIEWHRMEDPEVERSHNPINQKRPVL